MFFTARKPKTRKLNTSNSKDSKQSIISASKKPQQNLFIISTAQMRLREAINKKFSRSEINNFKYRCIGEGSASEQESLKSDDMEEYQNLKGRRFNLKDYHCRRNEEPGLKYIIRSRQADLRRPRVSSQADTTSPLHNNDLFKKKQQGKLFTQKDSSSYIERRTLSWEKKQQWMKLGFQCHSVSKNIEKTKSPGKDERYQRLFLFRKQQKRQKTQGSRQS